MQAAKIVSAALMVFASAGALAQEHQHGTAEKLFNIVYKVIQN